MEHNRDQTTTKNLHEVQQHIKCSSSMSQQPGRLVLNSTSFILLSVYRTTPPVCWLLPLETNAGTIQWTPSLLQCPGGRVQQLSIRQMSKILTHPDAATLISFIGHLTEGLQLYRGKQGDLTGWLCCLTSFLVTGMDRAVPPRYPNCAM